MPVFRSGDVPPGWCELRFFEIVELRPGERRSFERAGTKEKLIVGRGACRVAVGGGEHDAREGAKFDLTGADGRFEVASVEEPTTLIRMGGDWGDELGGSGLFGARPAETPGDRGDPVSYPKQTNFDAHYHDCDEYWILFEGRGTAVSEGRHYEVGPGDCVATGMGHHHDFPLVVEPVRAVFFETTLAGRKRRGHLWNHTHGPAEPQAERV
jgi:mannose-6-phosphate isomerase-like protein (cupin superfamily)